MASYYVWSGATGSANGTSWANAYTNLTAAMAAKVAGDIFYVAHDHAEATAGALSLANNGTIVSPTKVVCVNRAGSVPPVSADRRATATIATTGTFPISITNGSIHFDGIIFNVGNTSSGAVQFNTTNAQSHFARFDNCSIRLTSTGGTSRINVQANGSHVEFNNTTVSFASTTQGITIASVLRWRNTPAALLGTIPVTLFLPVSALGGLVECIGVDFSAAGAGKTLCGTVSTAMAVQYRFVDCKLDPAVTKSAVPTGPGADEVDLIRSGASGVNYTVYRHRMSGELFEETTIVRTGGAMA